MSRRHPDCTTYTYNDFRALPDPPHQPLYLNKVLAYLRKDPEVTTVLDAGCGDGNFAESVAAAGYTVFGLDMSSSGIDLARARGCGEFAIGSLYEELLRPFARDSVDAVIAVEVIEHLYSPRTFVRRAVEALRPGGTLVVTTPYWGYFKNVALAVSGRMDRALSALWDGGHIKHWSRKTLTELLREQSLEVVGFTGAGRRIPYLWRGFVVASRKPCPTGASRGDVM